MKKYDAIIIGSGKAGKTLAPYLSRKGFQVAVVEKSARMYGGTCPNIGCVPSKMLVHRASGFRERNFATFEERADAYREVIRDKELLTGRLRQGVYDRLSRNPDITVYTGRASFRSPREVEVDAEEGKLLLTAPKIFINTGAETVSAPIPGAERNPRVRTSTSMLEDERLPRRLVIVGGGYIGMEFASMYAEFGSRVIVLESGDELLPREDRDVAAAVRAVLEAKGVEFRTGVRVLSVGESGDGAAVRMTGSGSLAEQSIEADTVLLATGRRPATRGLNLKAAGVETDARGAILVDDRLRTTVPDIWAMGDVTGGPQFTYVSLDDYRIVRSDLFGGDRNREDRLPVPYSVFIDPPLSHAGLHEDEARAAGYDVKVSVISPAGPRAHTLGQTDGLLKAVVDAASGRILGCTLFCADSSEVINTVHLAMRGGMDYTVLRDGMFTHPSMSEMLNELFDL